MLHIISSDGKDIGGFHLGGQSMTLDEVIKFNVGYVYADSQELNLCFDILQMERKNIRGFTFCGDQAKTILLNWHHFDKKTT